MSKKVKVPKDCKEIHVANTNNYYFIVAMFFNEQNLYLSEWADIKGRNTVSLCEWCICHDISYKILYPMSIKQIFNNPIAFYRYLYLKVYLKGNNYEWK